MVGGVSERGRTAKCETWLHVWPWQYMYHLSMFSSAATGKINAVSVFRWLPLTVEQKYGSRRVRGVARIFQRGGHRGYSPDCHVDLHAHINWRQEPLTKILYKKTNRKKVGFSTMAFTTKILSVCSKEGLLRGGHGHPRTPPSYAPASGWFLSIRECRPTKIWPFPPHSLLRTLDIAATIKTDISSPEI